MKITKKQLRRIVREVIDLDLQKGDVVLTGKFKNKRTVVKDIGKDDLGQPTVNGMKALAFRVEKLMPKDKWSAKSKEEAEEVNEMKITKRQLRKIIKEAIDLSDREANPHDGSMYGEPEGGYDAKLAEEAYDVLYDYLDSRPDSHVTFEELKEIVNDTRYLPGEGPISDDQINQAITELEGDGVMTALLMPVDYNDRSKGWTVGNIGY